MSISSRVLFGLFCVAILTFAIIGLAVVLQKAIEYFKDPFRDFPNSVVEIDVSNKVQLNPDLEVKAFLQQDVNWNWVWNRNQAILEWQEDGKRLINNSQEYIGHRIVQYNRANKGQVFTFVFVKRKRKTMWINKSAITKMTEDVVSEVNYEYEVLRTWRKSIEKGDTH